MNRAIGSPALKRKRPEQAALPDAERVILDAIVKRGDSGIWVGHIKMETKLPDPVFKKSLKSLLDKKQIKEVPNLQNKGRKLYMGSQFEPSKEVSGGDWYNDGKLDTELIGVLKQYCLKYTHTHKVATLEGVHTEVTKRRILHFEISTQQVSEILNSMVLDNDLLEVKSTGYGEYYSIPIGTVCYRVASSVVGGGKVTRLGAFASIPCGACPRMNLCTPDGVISPSTCVYYSDWLKIDF